MALYSFKAILNALIEKPRERRPISEKDKEPNKVFVAQLHHKVTSELLEAELRKFANVVFAKIIIDDNGKSKCYGFVTLNSQNDSDILVNLKEKPKFFGRQIVIKPAMKQVIRPYMHQYRNLPFSEGNYNLTPMDASKISIHALDDDSLLYIFSFLPLSRLISLEIVCRRWQTLIYKAVSIKFEKVKCIFLYDLIHFDLLPTLPIICKMFIILGSEITRLEPIFADTLGISTDIEKKLPTLIGRLCPNLKEITMNGDYDPPAVIQILDGCKELSSVGFFKNSKNNPPIEECLKVVNERLQSKLQDLRLRRIVRFTGRALCNVPICLKKLTIIDCPNIKLDELNVIPKRCPNLETFITNFVVPYSFLDELDKNCPNLTELGLHMDCDYRPNGAASSVDFNILKNVKILHFFGEILFLNAPTFLRAFSNLEVLEMKGTTWDLTLYDVFDFSILQNIKYLSLPRVSSNSCSYKSVDDESAEHSIKSFESILKCKQLKSLLYMGAVFYDCEWLFRCITECPLLCEVMLPNIRFPTSCVDELVSANPNKRAIKLVFNHVFHDNFSSYSFHRLEEVNYKLELRVFGTEISFVPSPGDFLGDDEADIFDELFDDDFEGGNLNGSMDSINELIELVGLAKYYGIESLPWEDQKKLIYSGYNDEDSDDSDALF